MSMTDPVADLLTRIRNGSKAKKPSISIPSSNLKKEIVKILEEQRYVRGYDETPDGKQGILRVSLKYNRGDTPVIKSIQRVSTPGLRKYWSAKEVSRSTFGNPGIAIISTSSGLMTNLDAKRKGVGGEVLLRCW